MVKQCKQLIQSTKDENIDSDSASEDDLPCAQRMIESDHDIFTD